MKFLPLALLIFTALLPATALAAVDAAKQPNIVFIISDDHDYEHLGFMGNSFVHTPTLDRLAASGTLFTTAHLPMSRCHPTLASFLSGRWPHQSGIYYNYGTKQLSPDNSLPSLLKSAGYATYVEGKYWEGDPRTMGFTHGAGKTAKTFVRKGQDDLFKFVDDVAGQQPMFIWWAPLIPHSPHNAPQRYHDLYDWSKMPVPSYVANGQQPAAADGAEPGRKQRGKKRKAKDNQKDKDNGAGGGSNNSWTQKERKSYAMEAWLDDGVSQLVAKLKKSGHFQNTLFAFVIDNGWCNGLSSKGSPFEKGVRTPIFFTWPGHIEAGQTLNGLVHTNDIYPTLLDYAGVAIPESAAGRSLKPNIDGDSDEYREELFGAIYPAFATKTDQRPERDVYAIYVRTKKWKYIYYLQDVVSQRNGSYFRIQSIETDYPNRKAGDQDLFAIDNDPYERHNLAAEPGRQQLIAELHDKCLNWWKRTGGKPLELP